MGLGINQAYPGHILGISWAWAYPGPGQDAYRAYPVSRREIVVSQLHKCDSY